VITGVGIVAAQPMADVLAGKKPESGTPEITGFELPEGAPTWGYEVLDLNLETELPNVKSYLDRTSALALVAGKRALTDAGLIDRDKRPAGLDIGCAFGTMMGCLDAMGIFWTKVKTSNPKFAQPLIFTHGYANSPSSLLCIEHGLRGPAATFSGERLAGAEALMFAYDQISSGAGEAMLVCASESLTQAVWNHFYSSGQLSAHGEFVSGTILGEGSVALLLECEDSAKERGAKVLAVLDEVSNDSIRAPLMKQTWCQVWDGATEGSSVVLLIHPIAGDTLSVEPLLACAVATQAIANSSVPSGMPDVEAGRTAIQKVTAARVVSPAMGGRKIEASIKNS